MKTEQAEGVFVVDMEGIFLGEPKEKVPAFTSANTSTPVFPLSHYAWVTQMTLASLSALPDLDHQQEFQLHLEEEYEGFCRDQIYRIQDLRRKNDNIPYTMYTRLAKFAKEFGGVFAKKQLVKVFWSNIDKHLIDLVLPMIIMDYGGQAILADAFAVV